MKNYWTEKGEHLLINGTVLQINELHDKKDLRRYETQYQNYQHYGISRRDENGKLQHYQEFENGKKDGIRRGYYSKNLRIRDQIEELIPHVRFQPATRDGQTVLSYTYLTCKCWLEENLQA